MLPYPVYDNKTINGEYMKLFMYSLELYCLQVVNIKGGGLFKISRDNVVKVEHLLIQLLYSSKNEEVLTESIKVQSNPLEDISNSYLCKANWTLWWINLILIDENINFISSFKIWCDFASTLKLKNEYSQGLKWDLATRGN